MQKSLVLILLSALLVNSVNSFEGVKRNFEQDKSRQVYNRQMSHTHNRTHFEMSSNEDSEHPSQNLMGFKFQKTSAGVMLHYSATKDSTQRESIRMIFRKLLNNGTLVSKLGEEDFNDLVCTQVLTYSSCLLETKNKMFGVVVDYNSVPFTKKFGNQTHRVYPTDIKVTVQINNTEFVNTNVNNITLVVHFNSDNQHYFTNLDSDNETDFTSGNLTYTTFEKYSLDQNNMSRPVYFEPAPTQTYDDESETELYDSNHDEHDESTNRREVHFIFDSSLGTLRWDPTIGATESFTNSGSSTSTSPTTNTNLYFIALLGLVVIVLVVVIVVRVRKTRKNSKLNQQSHQQANATN